MATTANEYQAQLLAVEEALSAATDPEERKQLEALHGNLSELLELLQQTAPTAAADDAAGEPVNSDDKSHDVLDDAALQEEVQKLKSDLEGMVGQKCSAPHQHSWGAVGYHNAIVCGVEDTVEIDAEAGDLNVYLRVLFTNPTHKEMLPCSYFLEGECRFDAERCHYSHGELIAPGDLREYMPPDFELLQRNCVVLAKLPDRIWYRGRVLCVDFEEKSCRVRLEGKQHKQRETDYAFEDLLPIFHDDDLSSGSSSDSDSDSGSEDLDDFELARRIRLIEQSLFNVPPTQALGEWEKHTRGIGSKLMAKMGYIHGTGLGSDGRGIITPISAQILPQGCSLDHCMGLREAANGDRDLFSVEKKIRRQQIKQNKINVKAYEREAQRVDVFSFLNDTILVGGKGNDAQKELNKSKPNLAEQTTKSLNVQSVRLADDISRKQREIAKVKESLQRNSANTEVHKRLQMQLNTRTQELENLRAAEKTLSKEQATRKTKDKLYVF